MAAGSRKGNRGFTLLELIIAINLVAIVLALVYSGIHTASRSWDAVESRFEANEELRIAYRFVRQRISQARPLLLKDQDGQRIAFIGDRKMVRFVAPMPFQRGNVGGLYMFTLRFTDVTGENRFEVSYIPYLPDTEVYPDWEEESISVLVDDVEQGEIAYYGIDGPSREKMWHDQWERNDLPPEFVRFRITKTGQQGEWPELVVPVKSGAG
jgi:general secretion pathway protein J